MNPNQLTTYHPTQHKIAGVPSNEEHFSIARVESWDDRYAMEGFQLNQRFLVIWMREGKGSCCIDFERYELTKDSICFVAPGHRYSWRPDEGSSYHLISYSREFIELTSNDSEKEYYIDMSQKNFDTQVFTIKEERDILVMEEIVELTEREFRNYYHLRPDILSSWLKTFLAHLKRLSQPVRRKSTPSRPQELANLFYSLVERDFLTKKMVSQYAVEMSVNAQYLSEIVKKFSGYSASHHIQQRIILEAKRLALHTNRNVKEIAYYLGFDDPAHFSKFFKVYTGTCFKEFRKQETFYTA